MFLIFYLRLATFYCILSLVIKMKIDYEKFIKPNLKQARKRVSNNTEYIKFSLDSKYAGLGQDKKYCLQTYGCQGNEADSEIMAGILEKMGFTPVEEAKDADIVIINTCAIRENAEQRIWGELGRLKQYKNTNPDLLLGVCGCMPQEEKVFNHILEKFPYVDIVFGTHNIYRLPEYIYEAYMNKERVLQVFSNEGAIIENLPHVRVNNRKAWVNIMYGCDEFCTYCIVPYTRGRERSRLPLDIIEEVQGLVRDGFYEITLLGQNVNAYGKDFKEVNYTFGDLLTDLDQTGIKRIRFTTSHPRDLDDKTIMAMANCKSVMPAIHLPVQSGNNEVLHRMNRKYTKEEYLVLIDKLKKNIPGISITTDIIVAFPGETNEQFLDTLDLVDRVQYEGAFTFIYSPREGTPAATYENPMTEEEKHERLLELNKHINDGYLKGNQRFLGKTVKVLVDGESKNDPSILAGYSEHNKLVNFKGDKSLIGQIVNVKITEAKTWFLLGEYDGE